MSKTFKKPTSRKSYIYTRSFDKGSQNVSLEKQISLCESYAKDNDYLTLDVYTDYGDDYQESPALRDLFKIMANEVGISLIVSSVEILAEDLASLAYIFNTVDLLDGKLLFVQDELNKNHSKKEQIEFSGVLTYQTRSSDLEINLTR